MPLPLIAIAAAASFACVDPTHHDGDNLRCANVPGSMRLQGIDAPEMPGACRPGRQCVDGDPYAARDALRALTSGKTLQCEVEDRDSYGRDIVNCNADGINISCAMIASGHAVPRYAPLDCSGSENPVVADVAAETPPAPARDTPAVIAPAETPVIAVPPQPSVARADSMGPGWLLAAALLIINAITWALFAIDKRRALAGRFRNRIAERTLLGLAALGGSPAAWHAISRLRHKSSKDSFKLRLLLISGVQAGVIAGGLYWWATA